MSIRITTATTAVLRILLEDPSQQYYGLEICLKAGMPSGTVYPVLARLEKHGWLESVWEEHPLGASASLARPRRRYYRFSASGAAEARSELAKRPQPGLSSDRYAPEGGT